MRSIPLLLYYFYILLGRLVAVFQEKLIHGSMSQKRCEITENDHAMLPKSVVPKV